MSALGLFTLILLQIGIAAAVARHWQAYEDLLRRTGGVVADVLPVNTYQLPGKPKKT